MVDAKYCQKYLDEVKDDGSVNECTRQIALADRIIINKTDLVSADELAALRDSITLAEIHTFLFFFFRLGPWAASACFNNPRFSCCSAINSEAQRFETTQSRLGRRLSRTGFGVSGLVAV